MSQGKSILLIVNFSLFIGFHGSLNSPNSVYTVGVLADSLSGWVDPGRALLEVGGRQLFCTGCIDRDGQSGRWRAGEMVGRTTFIRKTRWF